VLKESTGKIFNFILKIDSLKCGVDEIRNTLLGIEGEASGVYFESLKKFYYLNTTLASEPRDPLSISSMLFLDMDMACYTQKLKRLVLSLG